MRGIPLEIWGDGSAVRDYIYVSDVVEALILAAESGAPQGIFNVGSGQGRALAELVTELQSLLNRPLEVIYRPAKSIQPHRNVLDIHAAEESLHWHPKVSFEEGLKLTKEWIERLPPDYSAVPPTAKTLEPHTEED
jgi:UDP-glucose 4-epimerase